MNKKIDEHHKTLEAIKDLSHKQGFITIFLIFGIFVLWSIFAEIETTITASGKIISEAHTKSVKQTTGGVVTDIFVKEGDEVKKGQPLFRLDSVNEQTKLNSNIKKFDTNLITICRLKAQSRLLNDLNCSDIEKKIVVKKDFNALMYNSKILFKSNMSRLKASLDLLEIEKNISPSDVKTAVYNQRIKLKKEEFKNNSLVNLDKVMITNRLIYDNIISLKNRVDNLLIKAPNSGIVTDMQIKGTGEIISPFRQIASIVPNSKDFLIEAFISPNDIEKVYKGQMTELSFPSFIDPSAIPVTGKIIYVSADVLKMNRNSMPLYKILVEITDSGKQAIKKNNFNIVLGMPSAVFIHTGKKTLATYLLSPIMQMFKGIFHAN
ncbi:Type I secretion membrane fusion protein, HlyD family [hydrothermal vent metagenome]|uniref:Type I secretion membrane fusion protein, HlyD family n=1 Tax=hydrothermal vent metagenome TaxID=652676 RepID=A0A1W1BSS5_9ZZZZ